MPKPDLKPQSRQLEMDMIETALAGLREWRSDLTNPESTSDWQGCMRAVLKMFDVKRRPLALTNKDIEAPDKDET